MVIFMEANMTARQCVDNLTLTVSDMYEIKTQSYQMKAFKCDELLASWV